MKYIFFNWTTLCYQTSGLFSQCLRNEYKIYTPWSEVKLKVDISYQLMKNELRYHKWYHNTKSFQLDIKELLWTCERFVSLVGSFLSINKLGVAVVIHLFPFRDKQSSKGDDDCQNNVQWPKNLKRKMWKLLGVTDHVTNILLCTSGTFGLYVDNHFRSLYSSIL